jgi:hypothetical protein
LLSSRILSRNAEPAFVDEIIFLLKPFWWFMDEVEDLDLLCGLVVRVLDYRSGGLGSIPGTTTFSEKKEKKKKGKQVVGLERGPLSLVGTTEELLDRKVAAPV